MSAQAVVAQTRDVSQEERDKLAAKGAAMPDGSFPVANEADLKNAIAAYGRAKNKAAVKAHIIKRAKALGKTDLLPADWEGSTKEAGEPTVSDVHTPAPMKPKKTQTPAFLKKMYDKLKGLVGDKITEEDFNAAYLHARGHAGGVGRAEKQKAMSEMSYTRLIEMVNSALCEAFKKPFSNESYFYWAREIYPDYVIVCSNDDGKYYQIPYSIADNDVQFDDPVEVEQTFAPVAASEGVNLIDLCADGHGWRLFNELQEFADPPEWIPYLPKPGTYNSPRYGEIKITPERIESFVSNFDNKVYQEKLPIDAEHETKLSGALGWITEMRVNVDGSVDAKAEWTDRGTTLIEADRFKYFSPEWFEEWTDPATDETHKDVAVGGALTTRPFFKEKALRPLVASERGLEETSLDPKELREATTIIFTALVPVTKESTMSTAATGEKTGVENKTPEEKAEAQSFAEVQAALKAAEERATKAEEESKKHLERTSAVERELRTKRFTDTIKDVEGNGGKRFIGDVQKHLDFMEKLSEAFGETSDEVKHYTTEQQTHAEQMRAGQLFAEVGRTGTGGTGSAYAEIETKARAMAEKDPNLTLEQAISKAAESDPKLYDRYQAELKGE